MLSLNPGWWPLQRTLPVAISAPKGQNLNQNVDVAPVLGQLLENPPRVTSNLITGREPEQKILEQALVVVFGAVNESVEEHLPASDCRHPPGPYHRDGE